MKTFNLRVTLEDEKQCAGCPALNWDDETATWECGDLFRTLRRGFFKNVPRPDWCPLIPHVEAKIEPTPLTPEELAELEKQE
jgi:hypothetical protein